MAQYDGSIRIGTGIDTKGLKAGSKELESEARRMAKTVSKDLGDSAKIALQKQTDAFVKQNQQYAQQEQKIKDLGSRLHELQRTKVETPVFKETSKELASAEKKLDNLYGTLTKLEAEGKKDTTPYKNAEIQIDLYKKKVSELQNQIKELKYSGEAYQPVDASKIEQIKKQIAEAEQKQMQMYTALQTSADSFSIKIEQSVNKESERAEKLKEEASEEERLAAIRESAVVGNQRIVEVMERRKQLLQEIADMENVGIGAGYQQFDSAQQELASLNQEIKDYANGTSEAKASYVSLADSVKQAFQTMGRGLRDIPIAALKASIKGMGKLITKTFVLPFKIFGNVSKKAISSIVPLLKRATSMMLGFGKSARKTTGTIGSRFKSLALSMLIFNQISKAFRAMSSAIKEGFGNLYQDVDSFRGAVDGLKASSLTLKNSFAAAFRPLVEFAIPYIQRTIDALASLLNMIGQFTAAITGQKTYTKAIKQTTAAIEEESKAQNKQLSGLDKLNNRSSDSGGGASGDSGSTMFEEKVPISSGILGMYQNIKDLIESKDWEGLGAYIANALNQGLQKVYDVINWNNVGPYVTAFIDAFTGTFNSLVDKFDWDLLGRTIGAGINTITNTLYLLITGIDWVNLGSKLAEGLNGLAKEVDAQKIGMLIGEKFMILPRILLGLVSNLDWGVIGTQIGNALNGVVSSIDLSQIGELLGKGLTGIFQMAIDFSATFDWKALGTNIYQGINSFFANTNWATVGQGISDFVMGILDTILVAVQGVDWAEVGRSIVDFIVNVDWIGLAAKLLEIGAYLIAGLLEGILSAVVGIGGWIKENVVDPIINWFKELFGIHSPSTVMEEMGGFLMEGLFNGIGSLVDSVKAIWEGMKNTAVTIWNAVKEKVSVIVSNIKSVITSALTLIKTIWSTGWNFVKTIATSIWNGIKQSISNIINSVKTVISTALTIIKKTWDTAWTGMKNTVTNIFNAIWTAIKGVINSILGGIEGMANGVVNGVNGVIRALNGIGFDMPDWLGGKSFRLNIPYLSQVSIPRLATGTVVPPNNEFLAVLGDNKREPEVVSPISTMKQAVLEAIAEAGGLRGSNGEINLHLTVECEGIQLLKLIQKLDLEQYNRTGRPSFQM